MATWHRHLLPCFRLWYGIDDMSWYRPTSGTQNVSHQAGMKQDKLQKLTQSSIATLHVQCDLLCCLYEICSKNFEQACNKPTYFRFGSRRARCLLKLLFWNLKTISEDIICTKSKCKPPVLIKAGHTRICHLQKNHWVISNHTHFI